MCIVCLYKKNLIYIYIYVYIIQFKNMILQIYEI